MNSRLIADMIRRARFEQARREWPAILEKVAPESLSGQRGLWLLRHFFYGVAKAWFERGYPLDALKVLQSSILGVPWETSARRPLLTSPDQGANVVANDSGVDRHSAPTVACRMLERGAMMIAESKDEHILSLLHFLADALEVEALGESVYPPGFPMASRWKQPDWVDCRDEGGHKLLGWHPARVVRTSAEAVTLVFATTEHEDPYQGARILLRSFTDVQWQLATGTPITEAAGYYLFSVYEGGGMTARNLSGPDRTLQPGEGAA